MDGDLFFFLEKRKGRRRVQHRYRTVGRGVLLSFIYYYRVAALKRALCILPFCFMIDLLVFFLLVFFLLVFFLPSMMLLLCFCCCYLVVIINNCSATKEEEEEEEEEEKLSLYLVLFPPSLRWLTPS